MANLAQAVNVLQSLFLTQGEKLVRTPTYHVFDLYQAHQGGRAVRIEIDESPAATFAAGGEKRTMPALAGSASIKGSTLTLTLTHAHARHPLDVSIDVRGGRAVKPIETRLLTHEDLHAHNTFDAPDTVTPAATRAHDDAEPVHTLPPASVIRLTLRPT